MSEQTEPAQPQHEDRPDIKQITGLSVDINYPVDEELAVIFANNLAIQITEHECILNFYQVIPSLHLTLGKEMHPSGITPKCVSRIGIPRSRLKPFVDALKDVSEAASSPQPKGERP